MILMWQSIVPISNGGQQVKPKTHHELIKLATC
jgi:hypothetical protein